MPAPTIRSQAETVDTAPRTNPTHVLPATINTGDTILVWISTGTSFTITTGPTGFTQLESRVNVVQQQLWAKIADGTEDGTTITFTTSSNRTWCIKSIAVAGGPDTLVNPDIEVNGSTPGSGTTPATPAVTTDTDNSLCFTSITGSNAIDPLTVPSTWTLTDEGESTGGTGTHHYAVAEKVQTTAGSTGTNTWTSQVSTSYAMITVTVTDGSINQPPVANAGAVQIVRPSDTVVLSGSGTDAEGTTLTYAWSVLGQNAGDISLSSTTVASPTFTAPNNREVYVFGLVVTDQAGAGVASAQALTSVIVDTVEPIQMGASGVG